MFMLFHLIKTYIRVRQKQNYFYVLPPLLIRTDAPRIRARIYTRAEALFSELGINGNLRWETVGEGFFCFCQKKIRMAIWDGELLEMLSVLCSFLTKNGVL